jgi:hypothetical protein
MSAYPPRPPNPLAYYTPAQPLRRRPLSVSIIAWIAIVLGAIGALGGFCGLIQHEFLSGFQPSNPVTQALQGPGAIGTFLFWMQMIGWLVNIILLITGVGCLQLKQWARPLMIYVMLFQLLSVVVSNVFGVVEVYPMINHLRVQYPNDPTVQMTLFFYRIGQGIGFVIGAVCPLIILYYFTRPHVKAAFEPPADLPHDLQSP